ncbi:hypothetical protein EV361DRAFT_922825 [Lentinula raphanica]|nr:hypothetical protein C8R42DRAFT_772115 [Lentinula raphanica]KAJ3771303.1 hypothetical protein FB446DRAFT_111958 [Lentinula raphanica]KAJ3969067.1 hypothetical protein EV361DRAFT_922825 [Lentinula raphanica]
MSYRPPSTSPSPSPAPLDVGKNRQSMGPVTRGGFAAPPSPRPGATNSARPTSELLGSAGLFQQTPEAEALDQWFQNLQNYEATLEEMAAASLDVNFKEELSAIEQWFKVLSEAERTAALYSLLQHSTQVQIRFFITVLQQMARSDPMTALLSPAMGGSMQSQMEAKLATLKSPGLKSGLPASPTARNFSGSGGPGNRQSLALDNSSNFLSPDSAALPSDPAATLAQQRAKFKASNASHRISAPVLASAATDNRATWASASGSQLGQVAEQNGGAQEVVINSSRPKSTEFTGTIGSPRVPPSASNNEVTVTSENGSWASMVNTPLIPMFQKDTRMNPSLDAAATKLNEWSANKNTNPGVPRMGDPTIHRRNKNSNEDDNIGPYPNGNNRMRNANFGAGAPGAGWSGARGPALPNSASNENGIANAMAGLNGLGMQMGGGGFGMGMGSPGLGGMGLPNLAGMSPMAPFNIQMLAAMGISPEAQLLAAQMAANGFGQQNWMGMQNNGPASAGTSSRRGPHSARSVKSPGSTAGGATPKGEEDVDPQILNDVPAWLRSLRLHKYTPNFEGMKWQDMVILDEAQLEAKGVAALGARRKMLKTFELVRKKMGIEGGPPSSQPPSAILSLKSA